MSTTIEKCGFCGICKHHRAQLLRLAETLERGAATLKARASDVLGPEAPEERGDQSGLQESATLGK